MDLPMISSVEDKTEITWDMVLKEWPEEANHYMEEVPKWVQAKWGVLCHVGMISLADWWKDISPSEVAMRYRRNGMTIWLQQRLPTQMFSSIRSVQGRVSFNVLTIMSNVVLCVTGNLKDMIQETPLLFSSNDLQSLRIACGLPLGPMRKLTSNPPQAQSVSCYIYLVTKGPNVTDVKSFPGKPQTLYESMTDNTTMWCFCTAPASRDEIHTPIALRAAWLQRQFKPQLTTDFLRPEYYQTSMSSYSAWSFSLHTAQVGQVLSKVPQSKWIVAPGDGIGVVKSVWKGENMVIAGDKNMSPFSDYQVVVEPFDVTMSKGLLHEGSILVLSYVYSLMTLSERDMADNWPGPIAWIDSSDSCPVPRMKHVGPGVYVRGFEDDWLPTVTVVEKQTSYSSLLYTENLIRLESIRSYSDSPSVRYWQEMRPFAEFGRKDSILVAHDLRELITIWKEYPHESVIYLASIGQYYQPYVVISLGLSSVFHERQVYCISKSSQFVSELKKVAQWGEEGENFLFCFPLLLLRDVSGLIATQGVVTHFTFKVISTTHVMVYQPYRLMGRTGSDLLVNSPAGIVLWSMRCPFVKYLIMVYMTYFGREGWKLIVTNDFNTKWALKVHMPMKDYVPAGSPYYVTVSARLWEIYQILEGLFPDPLCTPLAWKDASGKTALSVLSSERTMSLGQIRTLSLLEYLFTGSVAS